MLAHDVHDRLETWKRLQHVHDDHLRDGPVLLQHAVGLDLRERGEVVVRRNGLLLTAGR